MEVRADGEIIVVDAGSGIRFLGMHLSEEFGERPIRLTLLISHTHWDHIQGLPFFQPAYESKNQIRVLGHEGARAGLAAIIAGQMETPFFPLSMVDLPSNITINELNEMEFSIESACALDVRKPPWHLRRLSALHLRGLDQLFPG